MHLPNLFGLGIMLIFSNSLDAFEVKYVSYQLKVSKAVLVYLCHEHIFRDYKNIEMLQVVIDLLEDRPTACSVVESSGTDGCEYLMLSR